MNTIPRWAMALAFATVFMSLVITTQSAQAVTFKTLYSFCSQTDCMDGEWPKAELVQTTNGNLYGTTYGGGAKGGGTVFMITPSGALTTLYRFCSEFKCKDGALPNAGLIQGTDGDLYGTTYQGGTKGDGTVFKITPSGTLTTLHSFCSKTNCADGSFPEERLIQATNGDFYGTTLQGGDNGDGTVFKITPSGGVKTLHSFDGTDGTEPYGALIQATNGDLYGTTREGGANGWGTVFKITPGGTLTTLYSFCSQMDCTDGEYPLAGLIQATNGDFYGTTYDGGGNCAPDGCGTIYKITPSGTLTTLYSFCPQSYCTDGALPNAGLIQGTDGDLYGTTFWGGTSGYGTVFKITTLGKLTTLYSFSCSQTDCTDGRYPVAGLIQGTDGNLYGTAYQGGTKDVGTVFRLSVGLGAFVETQPTSGTVGTPVDILGTDLTGTTSVTFNGTAATFTVVSASEITTSVPTGATTGYVEVTTPSGTLTSNTKFVVKP